MEKKMNNVYNCNLTGSFFKHSYHNNINTKELIWRRWQKPLLTEDRRTFIIHCQYHVMLMSWRRVESWHQQAWHWPIFFAQYSSLRTDSYILWQELDLKVDCILPMNHFNVFCLTCHNCFYHCIAFFDKIIVRRAGLLWSQQDFERRWSVPLFKCLTVLEFSFIWFDLCLLITFFNFIMNYVPIVTFWIFTYHKIWILSIMFCFIWSYWIIYFLACMEVSWRVVS